MTQCFIRKMYVLYGKVDDKTVPVHPIGIFLTFAEAVNAVPEDSSTGGRQVFVNVAPTDDQVQDFFKRNDDPSARHESLQVESDRVHNL